MREIKFRYVLKHFETNDIRMVDMSLDEIESIELEQYYGSHANGYEVIDRLQYTGLKDKNNNNVYEGDICKGGMLLCTGGYSIKNDITIIKFENGMFKLGSISLVSYARRTEVIGNIYEHPYLLKNDN